VLPFSTCRPRFMHVIYSKDLNITFLIAPKAGYHTMMHLILSIEKRQIINTSDYKEENRDYLTLLNERVRESKCNTRRNLSQKRLVCVVRNPYARCISSFSDKLNRLPDRKFRKAAMQSEFTQDVFDSAVSFLNKEIADDHWRPISDQLSDSSRFSPAISQANGRPISDQLSDFLEDYLYVPEINPLAIHKIDFFYLEDMDRLYNFLLFKAQDRDVKEIIESHRGTRKNRTGSTDKYRNFINDINSHLIYQYYKNDFLNFGYSKMPEKMGNPGNRFWKF